MKIDNVWKVLYSIVALFRKRGYLVRQYVLKVLCSIVVLFNKRGCLANSFVQELIIQQLMSFTHKILKGSSFKRDIWPMRNSTRNVTPLKPSSGFGIAGLLVCQELSARSVAALPLSIGKSRWPYFGPPKLMFYLL